MKKYYLFTLVSLFIGTTFSQVTSPSGLEIKHKANPDNRIVTGTISDFIPVNSGSTSRATSISERLSAFSIVIDYFGGTPSYGYSNPIFPDTNAIVKYTSATEPAWLHGINQIIDIGGEYSSSPGAVFDPLIQPFDPTDTVVLDSVFIQGYYGRPNTTVVDTAIITITAQPKQYKRYLYAGNPDSLRYVVDFFNTGANKNSPDSVIATYKIILNAAFKADSLSNGGHIFTLAPNLSIPNSNGMIGVSLEFVPGKVYSQSTDTLYGNSNWISVVFATPNGSGTLFPLGAGEDYTIGSMNDNNAKYNAAWNYFLPPTVFTGHHPYQIFDVEIRISQNNSLTACSPTLSSDVVTACDSYTWINSVIYTASNSTAKDTLINALGCDSIVSLNLTITNTPVISTQPVNRVSTTGGSVIFSALSSAFSTSKQWQINTGSGFVNVTNTGQFSGATTDALTVSNLNIANNTNTFRCVYSSGSCSDTTNSALLIVTSSVGLDENDLNGSFSLFPNPATEKINITTDNSLLNQRFIIYNEVGKVIKEGLINSENLEIDLKEYPAGLYVFVTGGSSIKFVKE